MGTGSAFGMGVLRGLGEGLQEGFEDIFDRIEKRSAGASQYHKARATREEEKFQDMADDTEEGLKLLQGFFAGESNSAEMAGMVFSQYGRTLEGAKQAAEAGRLAQAIAQQDGKEIEFKSFFDFTAGALDPENPLTLDDVLKRQIGQFTYTPGEMVDVNPTTGVAKFLFGDVQKQIGNRVNQDLQAMGVNTSEPQPIENIMSSAYSGGGGEAMNALSLAEIDKVRTDIAFTKAGVALRGEQAANYRAQSSTLQTKMSTWTADQKADRDRIYSAIELTGAQAANQILDNKLLERFGVEERKVAIDVLVNEAKFRFGPQDWEEFDVRMGDEVFTLNKQITEAQENRVPQAAIQGLKTKLRAIEQARLKYLPEVNARRQADIISKTSPTTLWSNAVKSGMEDAQLGGLVKFDINGQIREITEGNEFKVSLAKLDVFRQFKQQYYGYSGTREWIDANQNSIVSAFNSQISDKLSHVYQKNDGTWKEGGTVSIGRGRGSTTKKVGQVSNYVGTQKKPYKTQDNTIPAHLLAKGEVYKVPYEVLVQMKGVEWVDNNLVGTKHYDEKLRHAYAVWGGGRKSDFRFFFNAESDVVGTTK